MPTAAASSTAAETGSSAEKTTFIPFERCIPGAWVNLSGVKPRGSRLDRLYNLLRAACGARCIAP